ncbi:hypothetical protein GCM10027413_10650 [Conyzicola nivalis]|uniref:Pheromone n=2 Tax=Conyzicola nivalis TaxID=1477021 RepID=A0A916WHN9_9MICO|nr:hypothetical protein GCM10010979_15980 [Conyzicola nivalis]
MLAAMVFALAVSGCATATDNVVEPAAQATQTPTPAPTLTESELLAWQQFAANNPGSLGPGEGEIEYAQARRDFPLAMPEGTTIPETTAFDFYAPGGALGRGAGYGLVSWTWLCATETELLDAIDEGDDARADESFAQLEAWMALPSELRVLEGLDAFRSVVIDPARAGDTEGLEADRQSWCAQAPFDTE